ncbi:hypothetical protein [Streptosporangium sp. V21-05]|uniref:hypothetical protein n=1 Tax=Streptosporangium sp. V21-05 TaxID=3446115 RepID=UPI003F53B443
MFIKEARLAIFLTLLFACLMTFVVLAVTPPLKVALGYTGTPGTATVLSCVRLGRAKDDCDARFVFDDRRLLDSPSSSRLVRGVGSGSQSHAAGLRASRRGRPTS